MISMLSIFISCEKEDAKTEVSNEVLTARNEIQRLKDGMVIIQKELNNNPNLLSNMRSYSRTNTGTNQYIDQASLDYLLASAGLSDLNISLTEVNELISENLYAKNLGYAEFIEDELNYTSKTKEMLHTIIINKQVIDDLNNNIDYNSLQLNEKQIILQVNETMRVSDASVDGFAVGSSVGCAVGWVACGPPCGLVGWLVGGLIGSQTK